MAESVAELNEETASWFITRTCQLLPKWYSGVSEHMHNLMHSNDPAPQHYAILCGSHSEFYILPLQRGISDTDYLISSAGELAFSGDLLVLPSDMSGLSEKIDLYQIESYQGYSSFVRLRKAGAMIYNWKQKRYEFNHAEFPNLYIALNLNDLANVYRSIDIDRPNETGKIPNEVRGPAVKGYHGECDAVTSVWCPHWPREAQNWPTRRRNYGWPAIDTISEVIENGCHVVYAQHHSCRDDKYQWRLSFSFAEVILVQSWTQVQQIVYHLLRLLAKRELIQKDCPKKDEVFCMYHFKTLMPWTCEEMSPQWWNSSSVIAICSELLHKLSDWLNRRMCPNYFIPEANLFGEHWKYTMACETKRRLNAFCNSEILCSWFVENCILPFTRRYFKVQYTKEIKPCFALQLLDFWKVNESKSFDKKISYNFQNCLKNYLLLIKPGFTSGMLFFLKNAYYDQTVCSNIHICECINELLPTITNILGFTYLNNLLYSLHMAYGLGCGEISWDSNLLFEFANGILMQPKIVRSQYHNFPKTYTEQCSRFQFLRAHYLMQYSTGSNYNAEFQLLSLLSRMLLREALYASLESECRCGKYIATATLAYLAALHFASSDYQLTKRFCLAILDNPDPQKDKESLNAGCLLFIDDIARIVGFSVLHKKVTEKNLHYENKRLYLDLRLSSQVFAYYLNMLSDELTFSCSYFLYDLPLSAFPMDDYLKASIKLKCVLSVKLSVPPNELRQIVYRRTDSWSENECGRSNPLIVTQILIDALMEYAVENMALFYSVMHTDFGIQCNTANCYRALLLYKRRRYEEMMNLCEGILYEPDLQGELKEFSSTNVLVLPPLDSFFDRDVQSLLGLHTLFWYLSPLKEKLEKLTSESTFAQWFATMVYFERWKLSDSLARHYSIKCNYFLGRHFLARYLKVRCCIDCNLPHAKTMTEFAAIKINLPFEYIIYRLHLQKLLIINK